MTAKRARSMVGVMVCVLVMMILTVAASPVPSVDDLEKASAMRLLSWAVVLEAGVIVALAGSIAQAYRSRVAALEKQIAACRACSEKIAEAIDRVKR